MCESRDRVFAFARRGYLHRSAVLIYTCSTPHCGVLSASGDESLREGIIDIWVHNLRLIPNREG